MTPTEKHRETAEQIANDFRMIEDGCEGDLMEMIAAALAKAEHEASANLIGIIADIRQKSGVGGKPMLGEMADAIEARIDEARREGMKRAADLIRCDCCDVCGESPGYPKCANEMADAVLSEAGEG